MLIVGDLDRPLLGRRLARAGLRLRTGPLTICVRSPLAEVADGIALHYAEHPLGDDADYADFHVSIERPGGVRRWVNRQVLFRFDGEVSFAPLPGHQGFPLLEWGLNWCVYAHCHQFLSFHAAVLERSSGALILPGPPGAGKSTLCAGLAFRGWRLLSDELTLVDPSSGHVVPIPRPISLKNASIDVIRAFAPEVRIGRVVHETTKGSVAHARPPAPSVQRATETAPPAWIVFPRYVPGASAELAPVPKARAFIRMAEQSFNYHIHGRRGFAVLADLIEHCQCHDLTYGRLEDAIPTLAALCGDRT